MPPSPRRSVIRPFESADAGPAAALLADRHRRHRLAEPLLDPAFEEPAAARAEILALLSRPRAGGWVAEDGAELAGYVIGTAKDEATWGRNVWVEAAGCAARDGSVVRALYATAAAAWAAEDRLDHHVVVPATDGMLVEAWFGLDFGQQHVHALREVPAPGFAPVPRSEVVVRRAVRADVRAVAELELVLPEHMREAPVFSRLPIQPLEEVVAEIEAEWDDPKYTIFVAEHEGRVVGDAIAVDLRESSINTSLMRPASAGFLSHAAVFPEARGLGVGRVLGETVLAWSRDAGYASVATDWRSTNLEADAAWRALGFRPTFRRLHRAIR